MFINKRLPLASIAGALLLLCQAARANETDDEINRLVAQAQDQAAAHATGDVARTIDEVSRLVPNASPEGVAAMTKLMENLDHLVLDTQKAADAGAGPEIPASPSLPAPQARPVSASAPAGLLDLLRRRGDAAFQAGDISGARRYYQRGAEAGCGACAEGLARTYDARELHRMGAIGVAPDPALAKTWRDRARQIGQNGAPQ